jgi:YhcH/YjgK/YiaL family protein
MVQAAGSTISCGGRGKKYNFMIIDRITNSHLYHNIHPRMKTAFDFLDQIDFSALNVGRIEIDGQNLYAMLQQYTSKPRQQGAWEAHRRYIDLQLVIQGAEKIGYANIGSLSQGDYDADKDFMPLNGEGDFFTLQAGDFALLFPQDAHMPGIAIDSPAPVKKIVFKIIVM